MLFHAVVFGVAVVAGFTRQPAQVSHEPPVMTIELVAAPEEKPPVEEVPQVVAPPETVKPEVVPSPAIPVEPAPNALPIVPVEPAIPALPVVVIATNAPAVAARSPPVTANQGDGSSAAPGNDATTSTGQPGVRARPNYLKNPEPPYPAQARRRRQEGLVLLSVKVTVQGRAALVAVKQSSGFPVLDEAAVQAVKGWEFEPARIGARAMESEIEVPVRFRLTN